MTRATKVFSTLMTLIAAASLSFALRAGLVLAQEKKEGSAMRVPSGSKLRATLGQAKTEASVESRPKLLDIRFGRLERDRFVAYAPKEPMRYDLPFLVQLRFASEPSYDQTMITLSTKSGGRHEVPAYKAASSPTIFRTPVMVFEDPSGCRGLKFCQP